MRGDGVPWRRRWVAGVVGVRAVAVVVIAAGVLALGGCSDGAEPEPEPSWSASVSPSPTASPSPSVPPVVAPVRPPEMERSDEVGAVAAARYFMELHEYAYSSGSIAEWSTVSGQSCGFCASVVEAITTGFSAGGRIDNGTSSFTNFALVGHDVDLNVYGVTLDFEVGESRRLDAEGAVLGVIPAESGTLILEVAPSVRGWTIFGADVQSGSGE